jgi:hypothetical protein
VQADHQNKPRGEATSIDQRIAAAVAEAEQPRTFAELRASCRVRAQTLYQRLAEMTAVGIVAKSADGYSLAARRTDTATVPPKATPGQCSASPHRKARPRHDTASPPLPASASHTPYS